MSLVSVLGVEVLDNPTRFTNPFQFQITFECVAPGIKEELEWKLTYVGNSEDEKFDQVLETVIVGPINIGRNKFVFQAPPPDWKLINPKDILEVTVILLTCSYRDVEFIRIGYYVNNSYADDVPIEDRIEPVKDITKVVRNILAEQPRVTRRNHFWDGPKPKEVHNTIPQKITTSSNSNRYENEEDEEIDLENFDMSEDDDDDDLDFEEEEIL